MARKRIEDIVIAQNRELGFTPGDASAHRAASALADRFDAPTIISLTNLLTFISEMGGQGYIVTLRERLTPDGRLAQEDEPGEYETAMLRFEYESKDARVVAAPPPSDVGGIPVVEFSEAPTRIEVAEHSERRVGDINKEAAPPTILADSGAELDCDGAAYDRKDWPELAAVLKDAYGVGEEGEFRVPDLRTSTAPEVIGETSAAAAP